MKLEEYRIHRGLSLVGLAEQLGIRGRNPIRTVRRYETGERIPDRAMIRTIAEVTQGAVTDADFEIRSQPVSREHTSEAA